LENHATQREAERHLFAASLYGDLLGRLGDDTMNVTYEIRTKRNARVFAFDTLDRAKEERARHEKRIKVPLNIVKITHTEEVLHD